MDTPVMVGDKDFLMGDYDSDDLLDFEIDFLFNDSPGFLDYGVDDEERGDRDGGGDDRGGGDRGGDNRGGGDEDDEEEEVLNDSDLEAMLIMDDLDDEDLQILPRPA